MGLRLGPREVRFLVSEVPLYSSTSLTRNRLPLGLYSGPFCGPTAVRVLVSEVPL